MHFVSINLMLLKSLNSILQHIAHRMPFSIGLVENCLGVHHRAIYQRVFWVSHVLFYSFEHAYANVFMYPTKLLLDEFSYCKQTSEKHKRRIQTNCVILISLKSTRDTIHSLVFNISLDSFALQFRFFCTHKNIHSFSMWDTFFSILAQIVRLNMR